MAQFVVTEGRVSRTRREGIAIQEETRTYLVRTTEPETLITPAIALDQRFPNPRDSGISQFNLDLGELHPEAVDTRIHHPDRNYRNMRLVGLDADWVRDSVTAIEVVAEWRTVPNPNKPIWSVRGSLNTEQTRVDIRGKAILDDGVLIALQRVKPQVQFVANCLYYELKSVFAMGLISGGELFATINQDEQSLDGGRPTIGMINKDTFIGPRKTIMLVDATAEPVDDEHVDIQYVFQYDPDGWSHVGVSQDKETGEPKVDEDGTVQFIETELYFETDFTLLPCMDGQPFGTRR